MIFQKKICCSLHVIMELLCSIVKKRREYTHSICIIPIGNDLNRIPYLWRWNGGAVALLLQALHLILTPEYAMREDFADWLIFVTDSPYHSWTLSLGIYPVAYFHWWARALQNSRFGDFQIISQCCIDCIHEEFGKNLITNETIYFQNCLCWLIWHLISSIWLNNLIITVQICYISIKIFIIRCICNY